MRISGTWNGSRSNAKIGPQFCSHIKIGSRKTQYSWTHENRYRNKKILTHSKARTHYYFLENCCSTGKSRSTGLSQTVCGFLKMTKKLANAPKHPLYMLFSGKILDPWSFSERLDRHFDKFVYQVRIKTQINFYLAQKSKYKWQRKWFLF